MAYAEVQVEGLLITLEAAGQAYTYHTGGMKSYVLCDGDQPLSTGEIP
jgi:hypothetical protein